MDLSKRREESLCINGRISGLIRIGRLWGIPDNAEKLKDAERFYGLCRKY